MVSSSADPNQGKSADPTKLARDLIKGGFSTAAVMDALATEGVERERARAIISGLHRASFEKKLESSSEERRSQARIYMALGCILFIMGSIWFSKHGWKMMFSKNAVILIWGMLTAGIFTFLYGVRLRK